MIAFNCSSEFVERFRDFLSSDEYRNIDPHSKTGYWERHSDAININISENKITIDGNESGAGFDIQPNLSRTQHTIHRIRRLLDDPSLLSSYIRRKTAHSDSGISLLNHFEAFDKVMTHDPLAGIEISPYRVNFAAMKEQLGVVSSTHDICNESFTKSKYLVSDHTIRAYYFFNILNTYTDLDQAKTIIDIGAGNANLLSLLNTKLDNSTLIDIDLPEVLAFAILYLSDLFPDAKLLLPNEAALNSRDFADCDFVFLTPRQIDMIDDQSIDLIINIDSMQEMTRSQIEIYFQFIERCSKELSHFFSCNRVDSIPWGRNWPDSERSLPPNRFSEYPWNPSANKTVIYEICRLTRLTSLDSHYIRLEQMKNPAT